MDVANSISTARTRVMWQIYREPSVMMAKKHGWIEAERILRMNMGVERALKLHSRSKTPWTTVNLGFSEVKFPCQRASRHTWVSIFSLLYCSRF